MTDATPMLLEVHDLAVAFRVATGQVRAVDGISFAVAPGETLGIVGESGSGKSVAAYAIVGLLARNGRIDRGTLRFDGRALRPGSADVHALRGREIAFIFQSPRAALNPIRPVGLQIRDVVEARTGLRGAASRQRASELLEMVRIADAARCYDAYPHELSGGMCQRILIAMALAGNPRLLIADEPTTGLDVTTQRVVMELLDELRRSQGLAVIMITHDLGLAANYCRRLAVMSAGRIVEQGDTHEVLLRPREPYTARLVAATPRLDSRLAELLPPSLRGQATEGLDPGAEAGPAARDTIAPTLLSSSDLSKTFSQAQAGLIAGTLGRAWRRMRGAGRDPGPRRVHAVRGVSLSLSQGRSLGIVGESGSGKTTLSRMLARLLDPTAGTIVFAGADIGAIPSAAFARRAERKRIQVVFQDPLGSLNPRFTAYEAIANPLRRCVGRLPAHDVAQRVRNATIQAGLDPALLGRFPHQLSGGQQARVGIARALAVEPEVLILDEPTSALDVSVQAIVLNRLDRLRRTLGLSFIFVSHDLNVVRLMCEDVIVMRAGEVVESGPARRVLTEPQHPYTRELIAAIPQFPSAHGASHAASFAHA